MPLETACSSAISASWLPMAMTLLSDMLYCTDFYPPHRSRNFAYKHEMIPCLGYYWCVTNKQAQTQWFEITITYYGHRFCGSGIWRGTARGGWSLLYDAWNLSWEDSKVVGMTWWPSPYLTGGFYTHMSQWVTQRPKVATSMLITWCLHMTWLLHHMVASGWSKQCSSSGL